MKRKFENVPPKEFRSISKKNYSKAQQIITNIWDQVDTIYEEKRRASNRGDYQGILHTFQEMVHLYQIALGIFDEPKMQGDIVQCGTYRGGTAALLGTAVKKRKLEEIVLTIDNFIPIEMEPHRKLLANLVGQNHVISVWSDDSFFLNRFLPESIRMWVLDSSHTYDHVCYQLKLITERLASGGWVVVHDYTEHYNGRFLEGVVKAVDEWLDTVETSIVWTTDRFLYAKIA